MSKSTEQQTSFLALVPTYRRIELLDDERYVLRRYSSASAASVVSFSSSSSESLTGYGPNGFLILTSSIEFETVDDEDG